MITFDRVTAFGMAGSTIASYYLYNCQFIGVNLHCEAAVDGIFVDGDDVYGGVFGINGVTAITNIVHYNGKSEFAIIGAWQGFATNIVLDDVTGTAISDTKTLPFFSRKSPFVCSPPTTVTSGPYTVLETDTSLIINGSGFIGLVLPTASSNTGRLLYIKNAANQLVRSANNDVVLLEGGAAQDELLPNIKGTWLLLKCDGTNWIVIERSQIQSLPFNFAGATYAVERYDTYITATGTGLTLTLPTPANFQGRQLWISTQVAFAVVSDASNVYTLTGGFDTQIVPAAAGSWTILVCDGFVWRVFAKG